MARTRTQLDGDPEMTAAEQAAELATVPVVVQRSKKAEGRRGGMALVDVIAQEVGAEVTMWKAGDWGALRIGGVKVCGVGPSKREGKGSAPFARVHLEVAEDSIPKALLRGLEVKPVRGAASECSIYVRDEAQARKVGPILLRIAKAKAKGGAS